MKIIDQTADKMTLKDGNGGALSLGTLFILGSLSIGGYIDITKGWSNTLWISVGFFAAGILLLLTATSTTVEIDKPTNRISYQRKRLIGGSGAVYAIGDVLRIETRKQWRTESTGTNNTRQVRQVLISQSVMVLKDGTELPLDKGTGGNAVGVGGVMMSGSGKEVAIATQVASFMGVPFQEIAPPSGMGGINVGGMQL